MTQPSFDFDLGEAGCDAEPASAPAQPDTLSISEAIRKVNDVLHSGFGGLVWIRGELHNLKVNRGNRYFELVDDAGGSADVRQRPKISASLFSKSFQRMAPLLERAGLQLGEGLRVRMRGSFELWGPTGRLSFRVVEVDTEFTLGTLAQQRSELLAKLSQEGLVDANRSRAMPLVPLRVGVVTSADSEGWHDFRRNLVESGIGFQLQLAGASVQGANAPIQVSRAIRGLCERGRVDVIAVVRGGGSKSDLASFDHEYVARAIAAAPIPVLTGVGHDNDRSVADELAHTACRTPTACAQALIDRVRSFQRELDRRCTALGHAAARVLASRTRTLDERHGRVGVLAGRASATSATRVTRTAKQLAASTRRTLESALGQLAMRHDRGLSSASRCLRDQARHLDAVGGAVTDRVPRVLTGAQRRLQLVAARVDAVDPRLALERGWSITVTETGRLVRGASELTVGSRISTRLRGGHVASTVTAVRPQSTGPQR